MRILSSLSSLSGQFLIQGLTVYQTKGAFMLSQKGHSFMLYR